jgi:ferritin
MINDTMAKRLNEHLNVEFFAFYQYLAMAAYCHSKALNGFAHWFSMQAAEEQAHAMKIYHYIIDVDREVDLLPLKKPTSSYDSILDCLEKALAHEQHVTSCINDLAGTALENKDHATMIFLQWFVTEQVEEESAVRDIVDQLRMVGDSGDGLLMLDRELSKRQPEDDAA